MLRALLARLAPAHQSARGLLGRLRRDRAGNTLAIMAISMIPIAGMLGSALDLSRSYLVRTRLQQACDAGVLAARKAMIGNVILPTDRLRADEFFDGNWKDGTLGTVNTAFSIANGTPANIIAGTATTDMPMTIMKMFGFGAATLEVKCEARMDLTNTDVVFVLDVTGSMACTPADSAGDCSTYAGANTTGTGDNRAVTEKTGSRIAGLRTAVLDFYDTLADAQTPGTTVRYSFVPYSSTVNVGALIRAVDSNYIANTATYQSRQRDYWWRETSRVDNTRANATVCANTAVARSPATGFPATQTFAVYAPVTINDIDDLPHPLGPYYGYQTCRRITVEYRANSTAQPSGFLPHWEYVQRTINNATFKLGTATMDDTVLPQVSRTWKGCIEEVDTVQDWTGGTLPNDLNVNLIPSSDATRWKPQRPEIMWDPRGGTPLPWAVGEQPSKISGAEACPKAATRLNPMTRTEVSNYIAAANGFRAYGGTYHDIGLIWGGRMLSTTGIFAADNTDAQNTNRNIVFLTDGAMAPNNRVAGAYGYELLDHRISDDPDNGNLTTRHNARFAALCQNLPNNVNVWVVAFSQALTTELTNCADPGRAWTVGNTADLQDRFREIAGRIAGLRLNK